MGCDIHTMAEIRKTDYTKGGFTDEWKAVKAQVFAYPYFREGEPVSVSNQPYTSRPYVGRNYMLFSLLANVRNERSMSNIFDASMKYEERDGVAPIAMPRGIPDDASKAWHKECKRWGVDFHSHSYFTLAELIAARDAGAFSQTFTSRGYVGLTKYLALRNEGIEPDSWASYTSGPSMTEIEWLSLTAEQQQAHIDEAKDDHPYFAKLYIRCQWESESSEYVKNFLETTIPALEVNAPKSTSIIDDKWTIGEPDYNAIRLVFAFDN